MRRIGITLYESRIGCDGSGEIETLQEVAAHTYGVLVRESDGKVVNEVLIPANTSIPCQVKETFFTIAEGQRTVEATVTQGDGEDPDDVQKIAATVLDLPVDRPPGRAIEVTYFYDEQGRMHCQFEDQETGKTATLDHGDASPKAMNLEDVEKASTELDDREIL